MASGAGIPIRVSSAQFISTLTLRPPNYGFEGLFGGGNGAVVSRGPIHTQHVVGINGSTTAPWSRFVLRVDLLVRGARWRSSEHVLCTALEEGGPEQEHRQCRDGTGSFAAQMFVFVPATRPAASAYAPLDLGLLRDSGLQRLTAARRLFDRVDLCEIGVRNSTMLARLCAHHHRRCAPGWLSNSSQACVPISSLVSGERRRFTEVTNGQLRPDDWNAVAAAFILAAQTLPQPFHIVESGNLCGATTILLALLKRAFCPRCPLISVDPGGYRPVLHRPMSCARDSLRWAGLEEEVDLHEDMTAAISVTAPVGLVYLDDGKIRFFNNPLLSYLQPHIMRGAIVALDDAWQAEHLPHATGHYGQYATAHELLEGAGYRALVVPPVKTHRDPRLRMPKQGHAVLKKATKGVDGSDGKSAFGRHHKTIILQKVGPAGEVHAPDVVRIVPIDADGRTGTAVEVPLPDAER